MERWWNITDKGNRRTSTLSEICSSANFSAANPHVKAWTRTQASTGKDWQI